MIKIFEKRNIKYLVAMLLALGATCPAYADWNTRKFEAVKERDSLWSNVPAPLKRARWASPRDTEGGFYDVVNSYSAYRDSFKLDIVPEKAPLYITADQNYRLFVNGKFVCSGPARGYQYSWPFDEIDIAKYLKKGKNTIAVRQFNVGRGTFGYIFEGFSGVLYALDLGGGREIQSGEKRTKARRQIGCDRDTAQMSLQTNNQEHIDLRIEDPRWIETDFDDSRWEAASGRTYNAMPYYTFESRMIPMLEEFEMQPKKLEFIGEGKSTSNEERIRNPMTLFNNEPLTSFREGTDSLVATAKASKDGFSNFVYDFGKMQVGFPIIRIEGAKGGEIVDVLATELADKGSGQVRCGSNLSPVTRIICREGNQTHQCYQLNGFRRLTLRVRNNPDSDLKVSAKMMWSAYPLADKGKFKTSNKLVNDIWELCRQTQKVCTLDTYVDTPYREQAQWWGDARVQGWNTFFLSNDARMLRRGIRSISMKQEPSGLTYGIAPSVGHSCILPDYSLIWILTVWDYYWQTGSIEAFLSHKDTVDSIISYFEGVTNPATGLVKSDSRFWTFLDWCKLQKQGESAILNLWYLHALDKMAQLCAENGMDKYADEYCAKAAKIRTAIEKNLLTESGLLADGILPDGKRNKRCGIHAQTLAKICEIKGFDFAKAMKEVILPYIENEGKESAPKDFAEQMHNAKPSSYWVVYTLQVLCDNGYQKQAYEYISRMWKEFIDFGSAGELFNVPKTSTHSHAWSAHPLFLLPQILAGVKQESAGWTKVSINPNFYEDFADITWPTPKGDIKVSWKKNADAEFKKTVKTPKGMQIVK